MLCDVPFDWQWQVWMDANRFLSFKTCTFDFFTIFFLDYLNLDNFKFFINNFFLKNSKWPKYAIWQIFCTKVHDFLVAEPLYEMF
jgi:hypothetical protein